MFSVNIKSGVRKALTLGAVIGLGVAASSAALAQSMVVRSAGPSAAQYPAGTKLAASSKVVLKANDRVTVLDKAGTRVLSGPGTFTLDGAVNRDQTQSTQIASLLATNANARRARTGAVRGAGTTPIPAAAAARSPNLWFIDASQSGKFCVAEPNRLMFWRAKVEGDVALQLSNAGGTAVTLDWKNGSVNKAWPFAELPVADGSYTFVGADGQAKQIELVLLPTVPTEVDDIAGTLIANGCDNQLGLLVETLAAATPSDAAGDR
ncbi:hypothetical protein [Blastomonas sp.]|uniref:hypothetical protein n=1 Tax=Blastomonas sp. TaxID=1909299 RepID=UPI003593935D